MSAALAYPKDVPVAIDGVPQANIIPSIHGKPNKSRHRASVACAACRDKRTRCVVAAGETECQQCKNAGYVCVITYDDERRKSVVHCPFPIQTTYEADQWPQTELKGSHADVDRQNYCSGTVAEGERRRATSSSSGSSSNLES